ncbi:MAG: hypothetical protein PVF34_10390 [Gammaproteobacteria bacterium]|jgi:tetratricopeptide (TPR) repeat protein
MVVTLATAATFAAESVSPPDDPRQSINYWKSQVIDEQQDDAVALAHSVFSVLLRSWDTARVEPNLYVVKSHTGPWAASLADGNILLSRSAIDVCLEYGKQHAEHLLAFILGHELAHQRAEDLWHQKFLRLAGSQAPEIQQQLLKDLNINPDTIAQLERREAQADHDGLLIMASVGYDPFRVVEQKDFFTTWVENLWDVSCVNQSRASAITDACKKARTRALRTKAQLAAVATQTTLFELGNRAYVAGHYEQARHYYNAFGKEFPSRAVFANLGLTYLQQAINIEHRIVDIANQSATASRRIKFQYPVMLAEAPLPETPPAMLVSNKRGASDVLVAQLTDRKRRLLQQAIDQFEKAIRLEPDHRDGYVLLATSYLVDDNTFMTRGILQGKYIPQFADDPTSDLLLAMTSYKENNVAEAIKLFRQALRKTEATLNPADAQNTLTYTMALNLTAVLEQQHKSQQAINAWKTLAKRANQSGNSYLFQLAVHEVNHNLPADYRNEKLANAIPLLGETYPLNRQSNTITELWLDGEKLYVVRTGQGRSLVVDERKRVISASNVTAPQHPIQKIAPGGNVDRPLKLFGLPSRRIQLHSGEYLAYDHLSLAIHIVNNRIAGWFFYEPGQPTG